MVMAHNSRQTGHLLFCPWGINNRCICYVHMHACTHMNECKEGQEGQHGGYNEEQTRNKKGMRVESMGVIYLDHHPETTVYSQNCCNPQGSI